MQEAPVLMPINRAICLVLAVRASETFEVGQTNLGFGLAHLCLDGIDLDMKLRERVLGRHLDRPVEASHFLLAVRRKDDLAEHSTLSQHLMCVTRLVKRQPLGD